MRHGGLLLAPALAALASGAAARPGAEVPAAHVSQDEARLAELRTAAARLAAALVRVRRRPPALALVTAPPAERVHLAALLHGMLPQMEARAASLRQALLAAEATRTATGRAVAEERGGAQGAVTVDDGAVVRQLAERATARLAALPGPTLRPGAAPSPAPAAAPAYRLPAAGRLLLGTGELAADGTRARGILLATTPGAAVRAPAAGRIAYAGPFRAWRTVVIVDHGHGWTTLLAGLADAAQPAGTAIAQGAPIGRAGPRLLVELRRHGRPIDVTGFAEASG